MIATFAFVDVVGFTALTERHGDQVAARVAQALHTLGRQVGGGVRLVKTMGDGLLLCGAAPAPVLDAVVRLVEQWSAAPPHVGAELRAGADHGPAVRLPDGDYVGGCLNVAARVAAAAGPGQVLVTPPVACRLPAPPPFDRMVHLRGLAQPLAVYDAARCRSAKTSSGCALTSLTV